MGQIKCNSKRQLDTLQSYCISMIILNLGMKKIKIFLFIIEQQSLLSNSGAKIIKFWAFLDLLMHFIF